MSGPSLFALVADFREQADRLAELDLDEDTVRDTLESLSGDIEAKAQRVAAVALNLRATADAIDAHIRSQRERMQAMRARADRLLDYLTGNLMAAGIERVEGPGMCISWRKSTAVDVYEPALLPAAYWRQKPPPEPEPDKTAIKEAIKRGEDVPGARLDERKNLQVKA